MLSKIINNLRKRKNVYRLAIHDAQRYLNNSMILGPSKTQTRLLGLITARQHVVEKGLTMPKTRLGFGQDNIIAMVSHCEEYETLYDTTHEQYQSAIAVLKEYMAYHKENNYSFEETFSKKVFSLLEKFPDIHPSKQCKTTASAFFSYNDSPFPDFAHSRHTVRNYSNEDIPLKTLKDAIRLAQTAPSACNRQPVRVHICCGKVKDAVILAHQGNRGFGHLCNKVLVVTSNVSSYLNEQERNCTYIDGGIFVMNLLYALHYYHIGACTLNWSTTIADDDNLRNIISIPQEEEIVCLICIGMLPDEINVACSERINTERIIRIHE